MIRRKLLVPLVAALFLLPAPGAIALGSGPADFFEEHDVDFSGFVEARQGWRLTDPVHEKGTSISEGRLRLEVEKDFDWSVVNVKGDIAGDLVEEEVRGELREFTVALYPADNMDLKIGRQPLTWGTGDLIFINDLFPKDWKSFFIGRDDEYLKSPSDAVRASLFLGRVDVDIVYAPLFAPSIHIDGERLSYWNPFAGRIAGRDRMLREDDRSRFFDDGELAVRLSGRAGSNEIALYGYHGFWKTPEGFDPASGKLTYPELSSVGASIRGPLFGGIANAEMGYYRSGDDGGGDDPFVRNGELRFLAGFEREIGRELTGGIQYYVEWMEDYGDYKRSTPGQDRRDEVRHLVTVRITQRLMNQNLTLSLFGYYSPSDDDAYIRPKAAYKVSDALRVEAGANIFMGKADHTFFGQFEENTNAFTAIRYNF